MLNYYALIFDEHAKRIDMNIVTNVKVFTVNNIMTNFDQNKQFDKILIGLLLVIDLRIIWNRKLN